MRKGLLVISLFIALAIVSIFALNNVSTQGVEEQVCGDGMINETESCDDGNAQDGDGCSSSCQTEPGYECTGEPSQCSLSGCAEDDIMFRISSDTNAHGEVYNGSGNYGSEVCFSEIFGVQLQTDDPHMCVFDGPDALNSVLRLNGNNGGTNAHAEGPDGITGSYQDICYGNLACDLAGPGDSCDTLGPGFTKIVALSNQTNAHLELASENNYAYDVCCTILGSFENPRWTDYALEEISITYLGNTVKMVGDTTFPDGLGPVNFTVYEDDFGSDTVIDSLDGYIEDGKAIGEWLITQEDIEAIGDLDNVYFELSYIGAMNQSDFITIIPEEDTDNKFPTARIEAPLHRQIYFAGTELEFLHDSLDIEGPIESVEWKVLHDGVMHQRSEDTFNLTLDSPGQATVTLKVTDQGGLTDEAQAAILVLDSPGLLAYVNQPFHHQVILIEGLTVDFNASDSYVVLSEGSDCDRALTCLAGQCPEVTAGHPADCPQSVNVTDPVQSYSNLDFTWNFNDGSVLQGPGFVSGTKVYGSPSNVMNDKSLTLTVNFMDSENSLQQNAERSFTLGQCVNDGATFLEVDGQGNIVDKHSVFTSSVCSVDGNFGNGDDCCPSGFSCTEEGCVLSQATRCSDYGSEAACDNDPENVVQDDPLYQQNNCGETVNGTTYQCSCGWESDSCGLVVEGLNEGGSEEGDVCTEFTCVQNYVAGECVGGEMEVTVQATFNGAPASFDQCDIQGSAEEVCMSSSYTVACGSRVVELPFVSPVNIITTAILLAIFYTYLFLRRYDGDS